MSREWGRGGYRGSTPASEMRPPPPPDHRHPTYAELRKLVVDWKNEQWAVSTPSNDHIWDYPKERALLAAALEIEKQDNPPKKSTKDIITDWLNETAVSDDRIDELVRRLQQ